MKYLLLLTTLIFAAEMEVDGDLKVTGTVDANGNPITNVGAALSMTDAINGNVLQDVLRDEGPSEYKLVATRMTQEFYSNGSFTLSYKNVFKLRYIPNSNGESINE